MSLISIDQLRSSERPRLPSWFKVNAQTGPDYLEIKQTMDRLQLHTICEEARCPNMGECWDSGTATFMVLGDTCTRACSFCNVKTGLPNALDTNEPEHVADAVAKLGLSHVVITSVDRDDLDDGGAGHIAATISAVRARCPVTTIEVLTPDFLRKDGAVEQVRRAYDIAGGKGAININVLWEMGGAQQVLEGVLEKTRGLVTGVTCGAGMPYRLSEIAQRFNVMSIPTLLLIQDGEIKKRLVGAKGKGALLSDLQEYLPPSH